MIVLESNSFILMGTVRGQAGFFFSSPRGLGGKKICFQAAETNFSDRR